MYSYMHVYIKYVICMFVCKYKQHVCICVYVCMYHNSNLHDFKCKMHKYICNYVCMFVWTMHVCMLCGC